MRAALFVLTFLFYTSAFSQLNLTLEGQLNYQTLRNSFLNDIWGHVDSVGNEYAIVGLTDSGVAIINVTNPNNPVEVFFEPGPASTWRDIKTWDNHAYITNENSGGLAIIDMSNLPDTNLTVTYFTTGGWLAAHNLYIDENGICYIFGADRGNGGVIMYDLTQDPKAPVEVGAYNVWYAHDGMARGDTLYAAHINDGWFSVMDVSDKSSPVVLAIQNTPSNVAHNIWVSDDGDYVFTTDEISNGFIGSYDISDLNNIKELDRIQTAPGSGVIPHNTHFFNNYLVTSYYNEGLIIHDVSIPYNMVEVANYDTGPLTGSGTTGAWGAYPWLPSGKIIVSDVTEGLFVLTPNYVRGCYLEGMVTNANTSNALNDVTVTILTTSSTGTSDLLGNYSTGAAVAGSYNVEFRKAGFRTDTIFNVSLSTGLTTNVNAQLQPLIPFVFFGRVVESRTGSRVPFATVKLIGADFVFEATTDSLGNYTILDVFEGDYEIVGGKWGYQSACLPKQTLDINNNTVFIGLEPGYYDDFVLDFGWTVTGNASNGEWERGTPIGTFFGPIEIHPGTDVEFDCLNQAFTTGNSGEIFNEVDGETILTSPVFDATTLTEPWVSYYQWFFNFGQDQQPGNDSLFTIISNGDTSVVAAVVTAPMGLPNQSWESVSLNISEYLTPTDNMQVSFRISDPSSLGGHLTEAGIDVFQITDGPLGVGATSDETITLNLYPNPTTGSINIDIGNYITGTRTLQVFDLAGRVLYERSIEQAQQTINLGEDFSKGVYILKVSTGLKSSSVKFFKF